MPSSSENALTFKAAVAIVGNTLIYLVAESYSKWGIGATIKYKATATKMLAYNNNNFNLNVLCGVDSDYYVMGKK